MIFNRTFAPTTDMVKDIQKPYRDSRCLNGYWQFCPVTPKDDLTIETIPDAVPGNLIWEDVPVKVPSPWNVNGFTDGTGGDFRAFPSYPKHWEEVKAGWLRKKLTVPKDWPGCRIVLHFEAVAGYTKLFVNGVLVRDHFDAFLPFDADITDLVTGDEVTVELYTAHGSLLDRPGKYGYREHISGSFWGTHIAGIWQDVWLLKVPAVSVSDLFIKPFVSRGMLIFDVTLQNNTEEIQKVNLSGNIRQWFNTADGSVEEMPEIRWALGKHLLTLPPSERMLQPGEQTPVQIIVDPKGALPLWQPDDPQLLEVILTLTVNRKTADVCCERFGWREFRIKGKKLHLNDKPIQIKGDSWHFTGVPQMTRRYAYGWYRMLKDVGANGVRLHAQVFPRFYLDMADEMGICVLDETAIWFSDGAPRVDSETYWEAGTAHVRGMVQRDRNHPSVFGWSVCNETLEVTHRVYHAPKKYLDRNVKAINQWIAAVQTMDPTRNWISGDGEVIPYTKLPTRILHYADERIIQWFVSKLRKPWGVGETGMCYYGSPKQVSRINGDRAYESVLGRMEGLAGEAFRLISNQRAFGASYVSVFNLIWYGLKPAVSKEIEFLDYQEGRAGYQPERLGLYCTTLNPGYQPDRPLYEGWPLLDAVKAAYGPAYKGQKNRWAEKASNKVITGPAEKLSETVILSTQEISEAERHFKHLGLTSGTLNTSRKQLIVIDGTNPPMDSSLLESLKEAMINGSRILVWHVGPEAESFVSGLTGEALTLKKREGTSYLIHDTHPVLNGTCNADWYFSESTDQPVSKYGLAGEWTDQSQVLLMTCNTDWRRWNYQSEVTKTGNVYRSELEKKESGAVLARRSYGQGELILSTLDLFSVTGLPSGLIRPMIENLGVKPEKPVKQPLRSVDKRYRLSRMVWLNGRDGTIMRSNIFGWFTMEADIAEVREMSFWLHSPRSLRDLLIEPGIPRLDMTVKGNCPIHIAINGRFVERFDCNDGNSAHLFTGVPLEKGWNRIMLKADVAMGRTSRFKISFSSNKRGFLKEIMFAASRIYGKGETQQ